VAVSIRANRATNTPQIITRTFSAAPVLLKPIHADVCLSHTRTPQLLCFPFTRHLPGRYAAMLPRSPHAAAPPPIGGGVAGQGHLARGSWGRAGARHVLWRLRAGKACPWRQRRRGAPSGRHGWVCAARLWGRAITSGQGKQSRADGASNHKRAGRAITSGQGERSQAGRASDHKRVRWAGKAERQCSDSMAIGSS